jgi:hypothetical protein
VQLDGPPPSRQGREDEQPPSSATAMRESRLSALASDGGPQQLASVVLLKQPPPGTKEATATKLKSEINVPPLAAREMRTSFRDALLQRPVRGATPCPALKEIRRHEPQQRAQMKAGKPSGGDVPGLRGLRKLIRNLCCIRSVVLASRKTK